MTISVLESILLTEASRVSERPGDFIVCTGTDMACDWPVTLESPMVWDGADFSNEDRFIYTFSSIEKEEINFALNYFKDLGLDGSGVSPTAFPLPTLKTRLRQLAVIIHQGQGFFVLRGLNPDQYTPEDNTIIYLGLSSYIANVRGKQDEAGNMLLHIRNAKEMDCPQEPRPARDSTTKLAFHADQFPDILALHTRGLAAKGGDHLIASSYKIYNELAATRPDLIDTLARSDWYFDSRSLFARPGRRPLLFNQDGRIILNFGRIHVMGQEPSEDGRPVPQPTAQQVEALDLIEALAQKHQLRLPMQRGDMTFINNFGILHARDEFQDDEHNTRYLVRLWLKNKELAWSLPLVLQRGNDHTYDRSHEEIWNVSPAPRTTFKLSEKFGP